MIGVSLDSEVLLSEVISAEKRVFGASQVGYLCRDRSGDLTRRFLASRDPGTCVHARARARRKRGGTRRGGALYTPLSSAKATVSAKFSSRWRRLREPGSEDEVRQRGREREAKTATRERNNRAEKAKAARSVDGSRLNGRDHKRLR